MGFFDSIQNLINGASELAQGSIGDVAGGLSDIPGLQDIQDLAGGAIEQATSITEEVTNAVNTATESGQTAVENITNKIGL